MSVSLLFEGRPHLHFSFSFSGTLVKETIWISRVALRVCVSAVVTRHWRSVARRTCRCSSRGDTFILFLSLWIVRFTRVCVSAFATRCWRLRCTMSVSLQLEKSHCCISHAHEGAKSDQSCRQRVSAFCIQILALRCNSSAIEDVDSHAFWLGLLSEALQTGAKDALVIGCTQPLSWGE